MNVKSTLDLEELQTMSEIIKLNKNTKIINYIPVQWGEMNGILRKSKLNSIMIVLYFRSISFIVLDKHTQKWQNKIIKTIYWITQVGEFNTNYTSKV